MPLTARALNRALLARQMLLRREKITTLAAVKQLVAVQAQLARPPFVGLWSRVEGFRRDDLNDLLCKRSVVRGTALRATLHLMAADDYVAFRGVIQTALSAAMRGVLRDRAEGLDLTSLEADARDFFTRRATFDAFRKYLKKKYPKADERAMAYAIRTHVPLVQVPADAAWGFPAAADFALSGQWLGRKIPTDPSPPHALVKRYLAAFGPATPADAQVWTGIAGLRLVFDELRPQLEVLRDTRNRELFDLPGAPRPPEDTPAPVRFLPEWDNLLLAFADRSHVIPDAHRRITSKNLLLPPTFLVDGFVGGTWKVERKAKTAALVLTPFEPLAKKWTAPLEEEGDALLQFVEPDAPGRQVRIAAR
jgi:hypothetical protein